MTKKSINEYLQSIQEKSLSDDPEPGSIRIPEFGKDIPTIEEEEKQEERAPQRIDSTTAISLINSSSGLIALK